MNRRHVFNIIYISVYLLIGINVTLDLICMGFTELWGTRRKRKNQNENICPLAGIEPATKSYTMHMNKINTWQYMYQIDYPWFGVFMQSYVNSNR